jgi:hypothetical protein
MVAGLLHLKTRLEHASSAMLLLRCWCLLRRVRKLARKVLKVSENSREYGLSGRGWGSWWVWYVRVCKKGIREKLIGEILC